MLPGGHRMLPRTRIGAGFIFPDVTSGVFPGWGFVFLKSQAAKNSPLLAGPRCPGVEPAQAVSGADLRSRSGSPAASRFPLPAASRARLGKAAVLPLVCLKKHPMGKAGGIFFSFLK